MKISCVFDKMEEETERLICIVLNAPHLIRPVSKLPLALHPLLALLLGSAGATGRPASSTIRPTISPISMPTLQTLALLPLQVVTISVTVRLVWPPLGHDRE